MFRLGMRSESIARRRSSCSSRRRMGNRMSARPLMKSRPPFPARKSQRSLISKCIGNCPKAVTWRPCRPPVGMRTRWSSLCCFLSVIVDGVRVSKLSTNSTRLKRKRSQRNPRTTTSMTSRRRRRIKGSKFQCGSSIPLSWRLIVSSVCCTAQAVSFSSMRSCRRSKFRTTNSIGFASISPICALKPIRV